MERNHLFFQLFFIGILSQVATGYFIGNELTSNFISDEFGDKGSGEEFEGFLSPDENLVPERKKIYDFEYDESFQNYNDTNEESNSNSTKKEQEATSAEDEGNTTDSTADDNEELQNSNLTEAYKDKVYIEGSWLEFGENDDKALTEENGKMANNIPEIHSEDYDQIGDNLNTGSIGMGFFKEMREISDNIPNPVVEVPKAIRNTIVELPNNIRNSVAELPGKVRNTVGNVWNEVKEVPKRVISIPKKLPNFFNRSPAASTPPSNPSRGNGFFGIGK